MIQSTKSIGCLAIMMVGFSSAAVAQDTGKLLPTNAQPGECYARVLVPPAYETTSERVLKKAAAERISVVPAKYGWVEERVVKQEAHEHLEIVPATFKNVTERVMVQPETQRIETVPAVYETVTEEIMVEPAKTVWKKGRGPIEKVNHATGEIMCLVSVPAVHRTVTKRVVKSPAATRTVTTPAVYKTVTRRVVDQPATTRVISHPAEYITVKVKKLVEPAREQRIAIPAQYQTVAKTFKKSDGYMEWRPILCETNTTPGLVKRIQASLKAQGFHPGPVDGVLGHSTMSAVDAFQSKNRLVSGQLTLETIKALNVSL